MQQPIEATGCGFCVGGECQHRDGVAGRIGPGVTMEGAAVRSISSQAADSNLIDALLSAPNGPITLYNCTVYVNSPVDSRPNQGDYAPSTDAGRGDGGAAGAESLRALKLQEDTRPLGAFTDLLPRWRDSMLARKLDPRNTENKRKALADVLAAMEARALGDPTPERIEKWMRQAQGRISTTTINHYRDAGRAFYKWLEDNDLWDGRNPFARVARLRGKSTPDRGHFTDDEWSRLIEVALRNKRAPERWIVYLLAGETGIRFKALRNMTPRELHLEPPQRPEDAAEWAPYIDVTKRLDKIRRGYQAPLTPLLADVLRRHAAGRGPDEPLFGHWKILKGERIWASAVPKDEGFKRDMERALVPLVDKHGLARSFHGLRHTAGTRTAIATGDVGTASKILGHACIQTTLRYFHPDIADLAARMPKNILQGKNGRLTAPLDDGTFVTMTAPLIRNHAHSADAHSTPTTVGAVREGESGRRPAPRDSRAGCSAGGSASGLGPEGRRFDPDHPDSDGSGRLVRIQPPSQTADSTRFCDNNPDATVSRTRATASEPATGGGAAAPSDSPASSDALDDLARFTAATFRHWRGGGA